MLPKEIIDLILENCNFATIEKTRDLQSNYLKIKTKYFNSYDVIVNCDKYEISRHVILNLEWINNDSRLIYDEDLMNSAYYDHLDVVKYLVERC